MPITGAIFDFDGTIVDSMLMWEQVPAELIARYGEVMTHEMFVETEPMGADEECNWLHERLGVGESGQALFEELCEMVSEAYASRVDPFEGVREFLQSLADAGIPMIVASSTPGVCLRAGLRAHGLDHFFIDAIYTSDVGRGKEFPDVYYHALGLLGTERESTWVFEDAPFGVRTAHDAGFPTVALLNDHDGRDEGFLRQHCDILAHGYGELSLERIKDYARPRPDQAGEKNPLQVLLVAGSPEEPSSALVRQLAEAADYVIAADRGAEVLHRAEVGPDALVGDADSASSEALAWAHELASTDIRFSSEKYATDLVLAFECARNEAQRRGAQLQLTLTACSGGRPDHALGVIGLLAEWDQACPRVVEQGFECRILSAEGAPSWTMEAPGATFSVIALREGTVVSEKGSVWELDQQPLALLDDRGISNVVGETACTVTCHQGTVAVYLFSSSC